MEISPNSETKQRVRRRLIQSTLFPHKSQDNVVCLDEDIEPDADQEDDEEYNCGSQSQLKKNKKRKPKAASQSRASRKPAVNGTEIGGKNTDEEVSPATAKVDFFAKASERRKRQQKQQLTTPSPEKVEEICSPPDVIINSKSPRRPRRRVNSTPKKQQTNVTPQKQKMTSATKNVTNGNLNGDYSDTLLASPLKQIPDLRLEAKMTAEENSRIFAGKQIHPFFSFRKTGKKNPDSTGIENRWERTENNDFSPVHVFQKSQVETFSVDWRHWTFSESVHTKQDPEVSCSQLINEGLVRCLQFDNFLDIPPPGMSSCQNMEVVHEDENTRGFSENSESVVNLDSERMTSNFNDYDYQSENSLWTTKYQPEKAIEICGNSESVKFLNEWLQQWHEKGSRTSKCPTDKNNNWVKQDVDLNYYPSDCDSEYSNEDNTLNNVLLVTGPVGSGKSAAIYACAKEQGFQVIEVNTSDWRNGALVKQKFGEAVESHWLQRSMPSENLDNKSHLKSTPTKSENGAIELIPLSDDEDSKDVGGPAVKPINPQNTTKTLILFEDVDATTYEDRGFIATIQQLAETAKRPMILTSNSDDPDLPNNLDRLEVSFKIPSSDDLLKLAYSVCAAEKAEIDPCLAQRFIDYCNGDIRKTIMLLQFWCQGQNKRKDSEVRNTYAPLVFDTYAGHHVLPQMIPFGYTSKLCEMIDTEIEKSTLLTRKDDMVMESIEEEDENDNKHDINSKKDEMLRIHGFEQEENGFSITKRTLQKKHDPLTSYDSEMLDIIDDFNEEMPFETRNSRKKYNAVLSSDSEEECFNNDTCHPSNTPFCSKISGEVSCVPESSFVPETEIEDGTTMYSTMCSNGRVNGGIGIETAPTNTDCETNNRDYGCEEDKVVTELGPENGPVHREVTGDSHIEPTDAMPRDFQVMDECSRMDFSKMPESIHGTESLTVQETWRKLKNCREELNQYVTVDENNTLEALGISYGLTNLISEADLLLADCQQLTCDNLKPSMISNEKSHSYSWHEDQLQMVSTFAQHGFCVFAKRSFASELTDKMDLSWELLAASTNAVSLGKLVNQKNNLIKSLGNKRLQSGVYSKSILESPICNTIQSIVPSRLQSSLKGYVFHEYLSTLSYISRLESSRLSEAVNNSNQRRKRVARNYLSNGSLSLSDENISLLDQYKCYQNHKLWFTKGRKMVD